MKRYATYKPTDIAWLPQLPEQWHTQRIKTLFRLRDERSYKPLSDVNLISVYAKMGVLQHKDIEHTTGNRANNADGYKIVYPNDIIVNILLCWMGAIGHSEYQGVTSPAYDVYTPIISLNSKYYSYLFRTPLFSQQCYRVGKGIMAMRWRTYSPQFSNIPVPLPPRDEQDQIVCLLDWKVARINKLINKKRKEIEELKELKKAIISNAITKGLFSDIPMKKSGIPWLDNIPNHWELIKLKSLATLSETKITNSKLPYIGMENVVSWEGKYHIEKKVIPESICPVFSIGNILFGKLRPYLAKAIIADFDGICSGEFLVLKEIKCNAHFLLYYLLSEQFIDNINSSTYGSKMPRANWGYIGSQLVPIPPINEQEEIVCYLDEKCGSIDHSIRLIERMIDNLRNLKTHLISDVVTGRIDVRDIKVPEYEFIAEESPDDADASEDEMGSEVEEN